MSIKENIYITHLTIYRTGKVKMCLLMLNSKTTEEVKWFYGALEQMNIAVVCPVKPWMIKSIKLLQI